MGRSRAVGNSRVRLEVSAHVVHLALQRMRSRPLPLLVQRILARPNNQLGAGRVKPVLDV